METSQPRFSVVAGLTTGSLLAAAYSYAAVYMPIFDSPLSRLSLLRDHQLLDASLASILTRAIPLAAVMFVLGAIASRLLRTSSLVYTASAVLAWCLTNFAILPAIEGSISELLSLLATVWYSVVPAAAITVASLWLAIRRFGHRRS
jgi:hypothetical protein